jgi:hypothetical protein
MESNLIMHALLFAADHAEEMAHQRRDRDGHIIPAAVIRGICHGLVGGFLKGCIYDAEPMLSFRLANGTALANAKPWPKTEHQVVIVKSHRVDESQAIDSAEIIRMREQQNAERAEQPETALIEKMIG